MAKKNFGLNYSKAMIEINNDNEIILIETDKEGNSFYYNFTEALREIQSEANVNITVKFDNEIDSLN